MTISAVSNRPTTYTPTRSQPDMYKVAPSISQVDAGKVLHMGQQGPAVARLQEQLNRAGANPPLDADGKFGSNTDAATRAFQQLNGLEVDGKAGPLTHSAIRSGATFEPAEVTSARDAARSRIGDANPEPHPELSTPSTTRDVRTAAGLENPAGTPAANLEALLANSPQIKTNQDLINHCYSQGGGTWSGADKVASNYGQSLNALVHNRGGAVGDTTPAPANPHHNAEVNATGRVTNPNATGASLEAFPIAGGRYNIGYDRNWNNFDASNATHNSDYSKHQTDPNHVHGHLGVDIFAPRGQPVVSPVTGVVESVNHNSRVGGNTVTVRKGDTRYYMAHLNDIANGLQPGQQINAGDAIGTVGNTGKAKDTAPHLHFSMYNGAGGYSSGSINPFPYLMQAR